MTPVTRASMWPLSCSTTVVSQSCSSSFCAADLLAVEHAGADQRPVMIAAGVEEVVEIDGLMGAVEIADAEMQDAGAQIGAPVAGPATLLGKLAERFGRQFALTADALSFMFRSARPSPWEVDRRQRRHGLRPASGPGYAARDRTAVAY